MHVLLCKPAMSLVGIGAMPVAPVATGTIPTKSMRIQIGGESDPAGLMTEIMTGSQIIHVPKWLNSY